MFSKLVFTLLSFAIILVEPISDITLIDVDAHLEVVFLDRLDPGTKKTQNRYFENRIAKLTTEYFTKEVKQSFSRDLKIDNTIEAHVDFDDQGYPNPLIVKSAIKKLNKNEILLEPYVQLITNARIEGDTIGENDMMQRIQPNIEIIIKVFDNSGKLTTKSSTTSVYDGFITTEEFGELGFNKSSEDHIDLLLKKLDRLLQKGINRATNKLKL